MTFALSLGGGGVAGVTSTSGRAAEACPGFDVGFAGEKAHESLQTGPLVTSRILPLLSRRENLKGGGSGRVSNMFGGRQDTGYRI